MQAFKPLLLAALAGSLMLTACAQQPDPWSKPVTMPDGKTYYPPAGGWPGDRGGETGGTGRS